jgi:hypothetical protein
MKIGKLKKYQQRGGVKVSIKTTGDAFVPTADSKLIIPLLFSNCDKVRLLSSGSSGFAFIMHLKPDSTIKLRSQTVDKDGNPLPQLEAADRWRFADTGRLMENYCVKISLVETIEPPSHNTVSYVKVDKSGVIKIEEKSGVSRDEAIEEVKNQKRMHRTSMSGTGVHGVFIPGVITHDIMNATEFEKLARTTPRGADNELIWIMGSARKHNYNIQVFFMELIPPDAPHAFTTFREFRETVAAATPPSIPFPTNTVAVACKTAAAVISTFTKSSFWSYDTHGENIMTNGSSVFLLDFGRIYNIRDSKLEKIDPLLNKLLSDQSLKKENLLQFFGLSLLGVSDDEIKAAFNAIYNRYTDLERSVIIRRFIIDSTVADDIRRVRSNIFEILILFALIDGMTNKYEYKNTGPFQCIEYMYFIFRTANTFRSLDFFLERCSSTLDGFGAVCTSRIPGFNVVAVESNLDYIAHLLQGALVPSAAMGPARGPEEFDLHKPDDILSVDEVAYIKARDILMEDEELARKRDAANQEHPLGEIQLGPARSVRNTDGASLLRAKPYGGTIKFQVRRKRQRTRRRSYHSTRRRLRRGGNTTVKYK